MADGVLLWRDVQRLADLAVVRFKLKSKFKGLRPTTEIRRQGDADDNAGDCYRNGVIEIRIHRHGRPNKPLSRVFILDTLAHEIAHLREPYHGRPHRRLTQEIKQYWRDADGGG